MLHLLPSGLFNKLSDRQLFLQKIFLIVFLGHAFVLGLIALSSIAKKEDKFTILMHQAGATYVLMPLQKKVEHPRSINQRQGGLVSKKSQVLNYEDYLQKKRSQKGKNGKQIAAESVSSKKNKNLKNSLKSSKKSKASTIAACAQQENKSKNKNKKNNKIKLLQEQKNQQQKILTEKKSTLQEAKADVVDTTQKETQQTVLEPNNPETQAQEVDEPVLDEVIFVGYEQFDECVISSKIQHAVVQNWTPPAGLDAGVSCEMKIVVSNQGFADMVEIIKSSGILLYDTSARTALSQIEFPQEVYSKTIRIILGN